jgi:cell division transport system permease protein
MKNWLNQHVQALNLVLQRFAKNKLSTLLICLAIGVTLTLPSVMYIVLDNLKSLANNVKSESQISVFLSIQHTDDMLKNIKNNLEKNVAIKSIKFVSKEDALKQLSASSLNKEILDSLESNALPDAFFIEPNELDNSALETLKNELSGLDGVQEVVLDGAWIKRLNYLLALGKKAIFIMVILLAIALIAVIGNTVRMQILTQLAEIELSRLIGATNSFIRRPFLYAGALYGLIGGLLALIITSAVIIIFNQSLSELVADYQIDFLLHLPNLQTSFFICLLSLSIGLVAAYLSVSKSLFKPF